ncbi:unnamed protein product, partial [Prorocentrum cordatum]
MGPGCFGAPGACRAGAAARGPRERAPRAAGRGWRPAPPALARPALAGPAGGARHAQTERDFYYTEEVEYKKTERLHALHGSSPVRLAVEHMRIYHAWYLERNDKQATVWQKKSGKVVLAVLVCGAGERTTVFKGMNFELSLPTGSRCAEQVAIGSAAAEGFWPEDMRAVAILDPVGGNNPLGPCGVCKEMLQKIQRVSTDFCLIQFPEFEAEGFDMITTWFPGGQVLHRERNKLPRELMRWTCFFCGSGENTSKTDWCQGCKEQTRNREPGDNNRQLLLAMLPLRATCPHTQQQYVELSQVITDPSAAIASTKWYRRVSQRYPKR